MGRVEEKARRVLLKDLQSQFYATPALLTGFFNLR
jgi:hypothetical protein